MILHLTPSVSYANFPKYGGVEIYIDEICRRLQKNFDISVLNGSPNTKSPQCRTYNGYTLYNLPLTDFSHLLRGSPLNIPIDLLNNMLISQALYLASKNIGWDALHLHESHTQLFSALKKQKKPIFFTVHSPHTAIPYERQTAHAKYFCWAWDDLVAKRCDHIIALSSLCKENIQAHLGIGDDRISMIPSGVDYELFKPLPKKEALLEKMGRTGANPVLIDTTRIAHDKGIDLTLRAVADLKRSYPDILCIFCGISAEALEQTKYGRYLLGIVQKEGISKNVLFLGKVPHERLPEYLAIADIFVHPAWVEAFPLSVAEAMSCGKPVIGLADSGGPDDMVAGGKNGFLLKRKTPKKLAETIRFLAESPATLKHFGRESRQRVLQNFTWDITADKIAKIYNDFL